MTVYCVKGREKDSEKWTPERGLREGCSGLPTLFNIFHQAVMREAEEERKRRSRSEVEVEARELLPEWQPMGEIQ